MMLFVPVTGKWGDAALELVDHIPLWKDTTTRLPTFLLVALDCVWGSLATSTEVMGYSLYQPPCACRCISLGYIQEEDCWVIDDDKVPRLVVGLR